MKIELTIIITIIIFLKFSFLSLLYIFKCNRMGPGLSSKLINRKINLGIVLEVLGARGFLLPLPVANTRGVLVCNE